MDLPAGTDAFSCTFTPKGLTPGLAGATLALMLLIGVKSTTLRRSHRV